MVLRCALRRVVPHLVLSPGRYGSAQVRFGPQIEDSAAVFRQKRKMTSQPQVTVLIDTYNYGRFVGDALESATAQEFPAGEIEILVVDDGSVADPAERVKKYGARVQYLYKPNGGQGSAVNFGVERARGKIVAFLDADDYWLPEKGRQVVQEFDANPATGMVHHRLKELDTRTGEFRDGLFSPLNGDTSAAVESVLCFNATAMSSFAFRKSVLENILPIPEGITIQADGYMHALALFLAPVPRSTDPSACTGFTAGTFISSRWQRRTRSGIWRPGGGGR